MPAKRPVVRSDGKTFASLTEASRELQRAGIGQYTPVAHMTSNICAVCNGRAHGAYGFGWQYGTEWQGEKWQKNPNRVKTMKGLSAENEELKLLVRDLCRLIRCSSPEEAREIYRKREIGRRIAELGVSG